MLAYRNLKVAYKLGLGFGLCLCFAIISAAFAIMRMSAMNDQTSYIASDVQQQGAIAGQIAADIRQYRVDQVRAMLEDAKSSTDAHLAMMAQRKSDIQQDLSQYERLAAAPEDKANLSRLKDAWNTVVAGETAIIAAKNANDLHDANKLIDQQSATCYNVVKSTAQAMIDWNASHSKLASQTAAATFRSARLTVLIITALMVLIGAAAAIAVSRLISGSINQVQERLQTLDTICLTNLNAGMTAMAEGNLSAQVVTGTRRMDVKSSDEFGNLATSLNNIIDRVQATIDGFSHTQEVLRTIIRHADKAAQSIAATSASMATGMAQFTEGNLKVVVESGNQRIAIEGKGEFQGLAHSFENIFESTEKTGEGFSTIQKALSGLVARITNAAEGVATTSGNLAAGMEALAHGDLTARVSSQVARVETSTKGDFAPLDIAFNKIYDKTEQSIGAFEEARASLSGLIAQALNSSETIASASAQLASGNEDLSSRTSEQASSLEETAASMEEMTGIVKQNAENANHASEAATQSRQLALAGGQVVEEAVEAMRGIDEASKRISDIISVIDEIAFQTNLLALNAAVEAARVGEQGRGFAVVASEVRNLAGRSSTAAKEIKNLVQDSVRKVESGAQLVNKSGDQLRQIVEAGNQVAEMVSAICGASQEQSTGIEQVNKAVTQMDQITQENAALVEQAASSSEEVSQQAAELRDLVRRFRVEDRLVQHVTSPRPEPRRREPIPVAHKPRPDRGQKARLQVVGGGAIENMDDF